MILTQCAVCAAPLGLALGKKCGRCSTRYCGQACQEQHWKEGGHDKLCKKIKKSGGAEQYNANKKYVEAVAAAAEACADDTKGQTCYICTEALHWKTKEGLVRGCACRGTAGFAHVSCLAEQAKILLAEAEENNLGAQAFNKRWGRWHSCGLCEQAYHGVVLCALGWACWKTYLGRPEETWTRCSAMTQLGNGFSNADHDTDALFVQETELSIMRRIGAPESRLLDVQSNLALTYTALRMFDQSLHLRREVYSGNLKLNGEEHQSTLIAANNYANSLMELQRYGEAQALMRRTEPMARRVLEENNEITLQMRWSYAAALYKDPHATLGDLREAVTTLEDTERTARRVFGSAHPQVLNIGWELRDSQVALRARDLGGA